MSEPTGKSAAKGQSDSRSIFPIRQSERSHFAGGLTIECLLGTTWGGHMASLAGWYGGRNKAEVPAFKYAGT